MHKVLCFGDSNTWGTIPSVKGRYNEKERWPRLLASMLSDDFEIIEEGQPSRTAVHNMPFDGDKTGIRYLKACLESYSPDLVLIMLGTNDLKKKFNLTVDCIALGVHEIIEKTLSFKCIDNNNKLHVLLICPPPIFEVGHYAKIYQGGAAKSQLLAKSFHHVSKTLDCDFFDAGTVIHSCKKEGIHWQVEQHSVLAQALSVIIKKLFMRNKCE